MFDLAVAFATAASGLVAGSMLTLIHKRRTGVTGIGAGADDALSDSGQDGEDGLMICKESAPDDTLRCAEELGHWGWHRAGQASWWGTTWGCDDEAVEPHEHVAASGEAAKPVNANRPRAKQAIRRPAAAEPEGLFDLASLKVSQNGRECRCGSAEQAGQNPVGNPLNEEPSNATTGKAAGNGRRPFLTVPLSINPSESEISAAQFAERWINGYTSGCHVNPHKSQPVFFRGHSPRPWDGPTAA
jgi:hypothetical protein